jgi:hypothetical protein
VPPPVKKQALRPVLRPATPPTTQAQQQTPPLQPGPQVVTNAVAAPAPVYTPPPPYAVSPQMTKSKPIQINDPKKRGPIFLDMTKPSYHP